MNDTAFERYSRQIFIDTIGVDGQRKIKSAKVLIIGAGGLGTPIIQYLAGAGIGTLAVVDFDKVELHNLNRQCIHSEESLGQFKVKSAEHFVRKLNSGIEFVPINKKITASNVVSILADYDVIVDGSDNFKTRYLVNDACVSLKKPLVYGSIFAFQGQQAVFNYKASKNLRDLFPKSPHFRDAPNCDSYGVLGPLPGMIGSMMAMQVLKIIVELPVRTNTLTLVDAYDWNIDQILF